MPLVPPNVSICSLTRALREYDESGNIKNEGDLVNSAGFKAGMSVRRSADKTVPFVAVQSMGSTCVEVGIIYSFLKHAAKKPKEGET